MRIRVNTDTNADTMLLFVLIIFVKQSVSLEFSDKHGKLPILIYIIDISKSLFLFNMAVD